MIFSLNTKLTPEDEEILVESYLNHNGFKRAVGCWDNQVEICYIVSLPEDQKERNKVISRVTRMMIDFEQDSLALVNGCDDLFIVPTRMHREPHFAGKFTQVSPFEALNNGSWFSSGSSFWMGVKSDETLMENKN